MNEWKDISYLKNGTPSQQSAFLCLNKLGIFDDLKSFSPTLVSTVCLDIDTATSDLDIICHAPCSAEFCRAVTLIYRDLNDFTITPLEGATVCLFRFAGWGIEIYAQPLPVIKQSAYLHLCQTSRVLQFGGAPFRNAIRALKEVGVKTEPAVAQCLGLTGDPYRGVEDLIKLSDQELQSLLNKQRSLL